MTTATESRGLSSIGTSLREARTAAAYSLDHVAEALDIRISYLEALERGGLGSILGPAYVESMTVRYAMFLGLDPEEFLLSVARGGAASANGGPAAANGGPAAANGGPAAANRTPAAANGSPAADAKTAEPDRGPVAGTERRPAAETGPPSFGDPPEITSPHRAAASKPAAPPRSLPAYGPAAPPPPAARRVPGGRRVDPVSPLGATKTRNTPRLAVVAVLVLTLIAVGVLGGLELGLFSLFGGGDLSSADQSGVLATAAASDGDAEPITPTLSTPISDGSETAAGASLDGSPSGSPSPEGLSSEAESSVLVATTTTLESVGAGSAGGGSPADTGPGEEVSGGDRVSAPAAGGFTLVIDASDEAWVEVRDAGSGEALHVGAVAKGGSLRLESDGPLHVVVGRPEVLSMKIDGRAVATPNAFRWLVTPSGVEVRS